MGCVSSKLLKKELQQERIIFNNGGDCVNHVVSLTSTTYGALELDSNAQHHHHHHHQNQQQIQQQQQQKQEPIKEIVAESKRNEKRSSPPREDLEVINAWELMGDLEEEGVPVSTHQQPRKSPKTRALLRGFADIDARTPLKFLNQIGSPRKAKTFGGKENKAKRAPDFSPRPIFKAKSCSGNSCKAVARLSYPGRESTPVGAKNESFDIDSSVVSSRRRRSFSPLFDPELVALYEKELSEEEEQIKGIICATPRNPTSKKSRDLESVLHSFEQKCPPGGENAVVMYTTTLRGIRKTFEDCNAVRSVIESYHIHVFERDVSMDSGFKEELRELMGRKEVKVPLLFVRGRLIGGADQVLKLDEEGKLGLLFDGIPRELAGGCKGCGGVRFMMCAGCNGSCKVMDETQKKNVRCGKCNENGLIQCPLCC